MLIKVECHCEDIKYKTDKIKRSNIFLLEFLVYDCLKIAAIFFESQFSFQKPKISYLKKSTSIRLSHTYYDAKVQQIILFFNVKIYHEPNPIFVIKLPKGLHYVLKNEQNKKCKDSVCGLLIHNIKKKVGDLYVRTYVPYRYVFICIYYFLLFRMTDGRPKK